MSYWLAIVYRLLVDCVASAAGNVPATMRKAVLWRIDRAREGALHMADADHFKQIGENFSRVFNFLDVLAIQVADVKATGERNEGRLDRTESKLDTHVAETSSGFARVERRLGSIENRVESLETYAVRSDQRLESLETHAARSDQRLESIEAHLARADGRLEAIEMNVGHIDSTLLKLL